MNTKRVRQSYCTPPDEIEIRYHSDLMAALDEIDRLRDQLTKQQDDAVDEESARWCEGLDFLHTEYGADCSGCDSGDPLECVEVEIRQAIENANQQAIKEVWEFVRGWNPNYTTFPTTIAAAIKDKFGLDV